MIDYQLLKLTPTTADRSLSFVCPKCGAKDEWSAHDSDSMDCSLISDDGETAGGLATRRGPYAFHGTFTVGQCEACRTPSYVVQISLIDNPDIDEAFASDYLWCNAPCDSSQVTEYEVALRDDTKRVFVIPPTKEDCEREPFSERTVSRMENGDEVLTPWFLERVATSGGVVDRHRFGPFLCHTFFDDGGGLGDEMKCFYAIIWPYLTGLPARKEGCL